jgi:hypothetical protein
VLAAGRRKNIIHGLIEIDVTNARRVLRWHTAAGTTLSFTAFLMRVQEQRQPVVGVVRRCFRAWPIVSARGGGHPPLPQICLSRGRARSAG